MLCPHCQLTMADVPDLAGQTVACPKCGGTFAMPAHAQAPPLIVTSRSQSTSVAPIVRRSRRTPRQLDSATFALALLGFAATVAGVALVYFFQDALQASSHVTKPANTATGTQSAALGIAAGLCLLAGFVLVYLLPTIIAVSRQHQDALAIAALNILFGWSGLAWIVAFVWSLTEVRSRDHFHYHYH